MSRSRLIRLCTALGLLAVGGWLLRGYFTDDTFIHLRYAQNLLERGEIAFNPGEPTYGATSPLWIFLLAALLKCGLAPLTAAWVLGAACGALVILLVDAMVQRFTCPVSWKFVLMVALVSDPWFLRWTFSGMETPLATLMLLVLLTPLVTGRDLGWGVTQGPLWRRYFIWGLAAGLAGLVRPEFLLLAPASLPLLLWFEYFRASAVGGAQGRRRARPHGPILAAAAGWVLSAGPWLIYAWSVFGRALPDTAAAKSGGLVGDPFALIRAVWQAASPLVAVQGFYWLGIVVVVVLVLLQHHDTSELQPARVVQPTADADLQRGTAAWSVWGPVTLVGIAFMLMALLVGGYAVRQVWVISRYVSPLAPVMLLALVVVAEWLLHGPAMQRNTYRAGRLVVGVCVVAALATNWWIFGAKVVPHARDFSRGVRECYFDIGTWLFQNGSDHDTVAALDIGAVGFVSDRRILDLMGLVSPPVRKIGLETGFAEMVESGAWLRAEPGRPPSYLVDRTDGPPRWDQRTVDGFRFELLRTCALRGVGLRESQPWTVALYRLKLETEVP